MLDHFGFLAPYYDRFIQPPDLERWQRLLKLPAAGRMLDAGGGTGRVSAQLRPLVDQLVVSDLSHEMLCQAREKGVETPAIAIVESLPFPDSSFERILVVDALHHFYDQKAAIGEFIRILKPGGRLVIEEPDLKHFSVKMIAVAEKLMLMRSHFLTPAEIHAVVAAHDTTTWIEDDGRFAAWVIAEKNTYCPTIT